MKFSHLEPGMPAFLEDYPGSVAITTITSEWTRPSVNRFFAFTKFPLNLSWAFTIHTIKGKYWNV